jgi:fibronectin type 3 domain-containing protein
MRKTFLCLVLLIAMSLVTSCGGSGGGNSNTSGKATLQWTTPASYIDDGTAMTVAGYKIYYGTETGVYTNVIDVGKVNAYTVSGLSVGNTYFFAVTAYDATGVESDPTDEQAKTL